MDDNSRGIDRRTLVTAAAWAAPAVLISTAAPAMAASPTGVLEWNGSTFADSGSGFFKPGVQLRYIDGSTSVTSVSVQLVFAPAGLTAQVFGLVYGSGWSVDPYAGGDTVTLLWSGTAAPDSALPPFALDMHFNTAPTSFIATAQSLDAQSPDPLFVPQA